MRVVIAHNRYQSAAPSGENRVVDSEIELLQEAGIEVIPLIEDSDELSGGPGIALMNAAAGPVMSPRGTRRFTALVDRYRPDVLHVHNVFPLLSPWIIRTAAGAGIPIVQTVHNYRHTCIAGVHLRANATCEDCRLHTLPWPAVRHACYRGSYCQSAVMAVGQTVHRRTWRMVNRFLVTSPQMEERLVSTGVRSERIEWRPTYAEDAGGTELPSGGGLAFVGRLDQAKGVDLLLRAWTPAVARRWGRLVLAGDGPLSGLVAARAEEDPSIVWRGRLDPAGVREVIRASRMVALPSVLFEGFPHVAAEAMSIGRPLLMWSGSGFSRLADTGAGWRVEATPEAWSRRLLELDDASLHTAAAAACAFYERWCSPAVAVQQLQRVYGAVVAEARRP